MVVMRLKKVQEVSLSPWNFHCYLTQRGEHATKKWRAQLTKSGLANLDRALEHLRVQPETAWTRPQASPLGNHIFVIHFRDENRTQWRLFGHFYEPHHAFVTTLGGTERDQQYLPHNYVETCQQRKQSAERDFSFVTEPCLVLPCLACQNPSSSSGKTGQPAIQVPKVARRRVQKGVPPRLH